MFIYGLEVYLIVLDTCFYRVDSKLEAAYEPIALCETLSLSINKVKPVAIYPSLTQRQKRHW